MDVDGSVLYQCEEQVCSFLPFCLQSDEDTRKHHHRHRAGLTRQHIRWRPCLRPRRLQNSDKRVHVFIYFYKWPSPRYVTALSHQLRRHTTMQKRIYTLPSFVIGYNYVLIKQLKVVQNVESLL